VWQKKIGLVSGGEFGNTLGMIVADGAKGTMSWSHWEESAGGRAAVFQYAVPASASHYEVLSTFKREEVVAGVDTPAGGSRGIRGIGTRPNVSASNVSIVHTRPGYHGQIWVNPADGTILRVTMDADLNKGAPFRRAAILVEYGPVDIAGSTFICPVRGIALSKALDDPETITGDAPSEWLNETHFTHYHRFGSTTRILSDNTAAHEGEPEPGRTTAGDEKTPVAAAPAPVESQPAEGSPAGSSMPPATQAAIAPAAQIEAPLPDEADARSAAGAQPAPPTSAQPAAPVTPPAAVPATPGQPPSLAVAAPAAIPDRGLTLHVEVPEVLVPVVVRDKKGHEVGNLGKADFTVLDQGKPRAITGFSVMKSAVARGTAQAAEPAPPAASGDSATPSAAPDRFIVFLFDDRHLTSSDLAITQKAATRMLDEPLAATDHAAVLSLTGANSGITSDRAALQAAIMKLTVHQASQHGKEDCPDVDYYSADKIINQHNSTEFQVAVMKAKACMHVEIYQPGSSGSMDNPTDPFQRMAMAAATRSLVQGEEDARQTLVQIESVVRAMSKLQGQRTLILVSPGFLSPSPDLMTFKSRILDQAAGANVVINALDARGLYAGNPDASQGPNATISQIIGETSQDHLAGMLASENAMSELADGTGGTFFHNSNDLEGGLKSLAAPPEYLYMLGISLKDVKANGNFHQLQVKVNGHGLDVRARRGYFAPKATGSNR
jgi:VWFA-related protein